MKRPRRKSNRSSSQAPSSNSISRTRTFGDTSFEFDFRVMPETVVRPSRKARHGSASYSPARKATRSSSGGLSQERTTGAGRDRRSLAFRENLEEWRTRHEKFLRNASIAHQDERPRVCRANGAWSDGSSQHFAREEKVAGMKGLATKLAARREQLQFSSPDDEEPRNRGTGLNEDVVTCEGTQVELARDLGA